jgi:Fur family peroxide stress response transcriptional regulator
MKQRQTKYCKVIEVILHERKHATNAEILSRLRKSFPKVSATTVHRATSRLLDYGIINLAPSTKNGSMRYDVNQSPHDHFICSSCDAIRDTDIIDQIKPILQANIGNCDVSGRLSISGICRRCKNKEKLI